MKAGKAEPVKIFWLKYLDTAIPKYQNDILLIDIQFLSTTCCKGYPS